MPAENRSFADDLRGRSRAQLIQLLRLRPDLHRGRLQSMSELAAHAGTRASVQLAAESLHADQLHALEAVLVADGEPDRAARLLGTDVDTLTGYADDLWLRGLLWRNGNRFAPVRAVNELLPQPARLGPPWASLSATATPTDLDARLAGLSRDAARVLEHFVWRHPVAAFTTGAAGSSVIELVEAGLVHRASADRYALAREVALTLRGGRLYPEPLVAPSVGGPGLAPQQVDQLAGHAGWELIRQIEALADVWQKNPPRVMSKGGLSVADHRKLAAALEVSLDLAAFLAEVAHAAGLVGAQEEIDPDWLPTSAYDDWLAEPPQHRWAHLIEAWWTMLRAPSRTGTREPGGSVINVLGQGASWPLLRAQRHDVLTALAALDPLVRTSVEDVETLLRWQRPLRLPDGAPTQAVVVLREANWLGLVAEGQLSSAGRMLAEGSLEPERLEPVLPITVDHLLVQADLTAIAPGPLNDELHRLMHLVADVESRGGATVYRFSAKSLQRGVDAGVDATHLHAQIAAASRTELPQALQYLIKDLDRGRSAVHIGSAGSYLRSDDESGLSAMLADSTLKPLALLRLAPTVLSSRVPAARLMSALRDAGYNAFVEDAEGAVVASTAGVVAPPRAHPPRSPAPVVVRRPAASAVEALVDRMLGAPAPAASTSGSQVPDTDPAVTLDRLLDAAAAGTPVRIRYVDSAGHIRTSVVRPQQVEGGRLTARAQRGDSQRMFALHRISGVAPA